jgi:hypothetical protein
MESVQFWTDLFFDIYSRPHPKAGWRHSRLAAFSEKFARVSKMEQFQLGVTLKICAIGEAGRKDSGSRAGAGSFPCLAIPLFKLLLGFST